MATDFTPVVDKLLEKTNERKIAWKSTYDTNTLIASVDEGFVFELIHRGETLSLRMKDRDDVVVFTFLAEEPDGETSSENDRKWDRLTALWEEARIIALKLDEKLTQVSDILSKL
jgi:hypothetical protein